MVTLTEASVDLDAVSSSYEDGQQNNGAASERERLRRGSYLYQQMSERPTNEYVLNVAWVSFLLFTAVQFFFSVIAKSEAMMTDCAAMMVDVVTYLFNFLAERHKHGTPGMSARELRLRRLYLELIPPLVSVTTLIAVTVMALQEAFKTLVNKDDTPEGQPDLQIMLLFSGLNLLLDILNVHCFALVDQAVGLPSSLAPAQRSIRSTANETSPLLEREESDVGSEDSIGATGILNLNMCSAWTHVCADTLRSVAVLIAAGVSTIFPEYLTSAEADSDAAIVVSIIILASLLPLIQGLYLTACKIYTMWIDKDRLDGSIRMPKSAGVGVTVEV